MKSNFVRAGLAIVACLISATLARAATGPGTTPAPVSYNPVTKIIQGNQPLTESYVLTVKAPSNLPATVAAPVTVSLVFSIISKPPGVTDAQALGYLSATATSLTFTAPDQSKTTTVTLSVPLGNTAGAYAYKIQPAGWPATSAGISDAGAAINATVSPAGSTDTSAPAIVLLTPAPNTVYTYQPATGNPVSVPISFAASVGANALPIDAMLAFIDDAPVGVTATGLLTLSATGSATALLTVPGTHTVSVLATNRNGTSRASADISVVVVAPPPTITVATPGAGSTFSYTLGNAGAAVPVSVSSKSIYGNVATLAATLDGAPISLNLSGVGTALTAVGSATLTVATPGSHSLVFTSSNAFGPATPVTVAFNVASAAPVPTVAILTPANGSTFTRTSGDPATVVNYTFQGGTSYGSVTSVKVILDGTIVSPSISGLNSPSITGSGSASFSSAGAHVLTVTVSNGTATASASSTFNVVQVQPQICRDITWLPPISLNKTVEGGSTVPIKFTLECHNEFVRDTSVLIAIYEIGHPPVIYGYGTGSPNPPDYAITGHQYHLNFTTAKGDHVYRIEVYSSASGTTRLIGSKELNTANKKSGGDDDDDEEDDDGGDDGRD